jgi:NitT/TauT family transport system substrate-binding protein
MSRTYRLLSTVIAAMLVALSGKPASAAPEKLTFAWPSAINSGLAPMAFASELGFFKEENIEPEIVVLQGSGTIIPQLMSGEVFSAYSSLEPLPISRQPGKPNFAFKFVYNYMRNSIWEIAVLDSSPVKEVKDLAGKTIGVGGLQWGNVPTTRAILQFSGVAASNVTLVGVGTGVPAFEALKRGQIDALNLFDTMHAGLEQMGTKIRRLKFPAEFQGVSSHGFPATDKMIKERPDLIARFGRAMTKGTLACAAALDKCVRAYWKLYPAQKPADEAAALQREMSALKPRMANLTYFAPGEAKQQMGSFSAGDWRATIEALKIGGQIDPLAKIDIDSLYTNQFVAEFNKFDRGDVERKAHAYAP